MLTASLSPEQPSQGVCWSSDTETRRRGADRALSSGRVDAQPSAPHRSSSSTRAARLHCAAPVAHIRRVDHTRRIAHPTQSRAGATVERSSLAQPQHVNRTPQLSQQSPGDDRPRRARRTQPPPRWCHEMGEPCRSDHGNLSRRLRRPAQRSDEALRVDQSSMRTVARTSLNEEQERSAG